MSIQLDNERTVTMKSETDQAFENGISWFLIQSSAKSSGRILWRHTVEHWRKSQKDILAEVQQW